MRVMGPVAQAVRVAKALGDPMRLRIYREISRRVELSCQELVELFPISQPTISHHLKVLYRAGLLSIRKDGSHHFYGARREVLEAHRRFLGELRPAGGREPFLGERAP